LRKENEAAYDREELLELCRPIMEAWGSYLSGADNVAPLVAGKRRA
jgi:hypothetical protein